MVEPIWRSGGRPLGTQFWFAASRWRAVCNFTRAWSPGSLGDGAACFVKGTNSAAMLPAVLRRKPKEGLRPWPLGRNARAADPGPRCSTGWRGSGPAGIEWLDLRSSGEDGWTRLGAAWRGSATGAAAR